jgi:broad specificity phosphatase PhoE
MHDVGQGWFSLTHWWYIPPRFIAHQPEDDMRTQISLIRHGETDWNSEGRWQGIAPVSINDNGIRQAEAAAPHLKNAGITRVIASDLLRAYRTGEIIAQVLGVPIKPDPRWREIDLGRWQGLTREDIIAWDIEALQAFESASYVDRAFPEGENTRQHITRVTEALNDLAATYPGQHVLVATHGGSIRCAIYSITGKAIHLVGNCSVTRLHHEGDTWQVVGVAEMPESITW